MYSSEIKEAFFQLIRLGIRTGTINGSRLAIHGSIDWKALKVLAEQQGLTAVVLDGIEKLNTYFSNTYGLPLELKLEWIGEVLQNYETRYAQYEKAISSLAGFYNQHGFKMMVVKGYACSLDWPTPDHRPTGDIDIWLFGQQQDADKDLVSSCKVQVPGFEIDNSHHHHTVFEWQGFTVENHYDFINVHHHKSHVALEKTLKELGEDDSHYVELNGERVYLPSPNLHALFLLKHAALHFVGTELTFRQVLDWAFFVVKHGKDVDWNWLHGVLEEHGLMPFYQILNAICVGDLGFVARLFSKNQHLLELKERVVKEIFASVYQNEDSKNLLSRQAQRIRRWKGNAWKHKLCYKESMWSAFWCGIWGHLMKPSSI